MMSVIIGAGALVVIVMFLVVALVTFERHYVSAGPVRITVEGDPVVLDAVSGDTLLGSLADRGILLPAACGGTGTCGNCRIRVVEGAPPPLATERVHLNRRQLGEGWRLACQQRIRHDVAIALPAAVRTATKRTCQVIGSRSVATYIREIVLALPPGERLEFAAGSYVQVDVPAYRDLRFSAMDLPDAHRSEWMRRGLLDLVGSNRAATTRAYSLANPPAQGGGIVLNVRIATPPPHRHGLPAGVASSWLWSLRSGDRVDVTGPFGEFHIRDTDREMVYIGGGAGMAPLRSHLLHLLTTQASTRTISFWYGARSRSELFYTEELVALARDHPTFSYHIALSEPQAGDDWTGDTGFIHDVVFRRYLAEHPAIHEVEFYLCGPPPMMAAVRKMLDELGVEPSQISFDDFGT
jgi:Na+-transporting NADH:ubiquinone oxidoreductase subunit F